MTLFFDAFEFDPEQLELRRAGAPIKADPLVLRLLDVLTQAQGKLVTKQELVTRVWDGRVVAENAITVAMVRLRKTLGHRHGELEFVINVHGRGYRFVRPITARRSAELAPRVYSGTSVLRAPFVGRELLLQTLRNAWIDAKAGRGQACVLTGEAGIGKTRAVEVFEREVIDGGGTVAWGHGRESGDSPPLWPCVQILRQLLASGTPDSAQLAAWASGEPELVTLLPELAPNAAPKEWLAGFARSKHRVFDAITRLLARAAQPGPCLLVFDDLQRADEVTLDLLQTLLDQLGRMPILLLATLNRLDLSDATAAAHLGYVYGHRNTTRLALERLSEAEVGTYVGALVDDPSGELSREVYTKSEGNPFFMSELARQLRELGPDAARQLGVPDAALALVRRRLAILDDQGRGTLSCAAVIGRSFELSVLQAVTGESAGHVMLSLDDAVVNGVVRNQPDSRTTFTFAHELLRVALYDALPPAQRRSLHLRVAHALEERQNGGSAVAAADLALHFHAALPESDLRKTVDYCTRAATISGQLFAYADALRQLRHARQALELLPDGSPRLRLTLIQREALCARICGDPAFESLARDLIRLATELRSGVHLAWGASLLDLNTGFPSLPGSREALESALAALPEAEIGTRGGVLARLATTAPIAYDAARALQQVEQARELADRSGDYRSLYQVHAARMFLTGGALDPTQANESLQALEQLYQQHRLRLTVPPVLIGLHRAIRSLQIGDLAAFDAALERAEAICRRLGHRELGWHVARARAIQLVNAGEHEVAIDQLRNLHARANERAVPGSILFCAYDHCMISREVARLSRAQLQSALERNWADAPNIWSMKVRALAHAGLSDDALRQLRLVAPDDLQRLPRDRDYLGTLGAIAGAVLELGAQSYVAPLYELLSEYPDHFAAHITFYCEGSIAQLLGSLALRTAQPQIAARHFAHARALSKRAGLARVAVTSQDLLAAL